MRSASSHPRLTPAHTGAHGASHANHGRETSIAPAHDALLKPADIAIVFLYVLLFIIFVKDCLLLPVLFK